MRFSMFCARTYERKERPLVFSMTCGVRVGLGIGSFTSRHTNLPPSRPPRAAKKSGPPSPPKACLAGGEVRVVT